jgi:hypothetical protein
VARVARNLCVALPEKAAQGGKAKEELPYRWTRELPFQVRAMLLADETLSMAGPLGDARHSLDAFEGKEGITLWAVSAGSGEKLAEYELDAMLVFDGMAAAGGKLYMALKNGRLVCMGEA